MDQFHAKGENNEQTYEFEEIDTQDMRLHTPVDIEGPPSDLSKTTCTRSLSRLTIFLALLSAVLLVVLVISTLTHTACPTSTLISPSPSSPSLHTSALYTLDATWHPQFPRGAHTFSAVTIARLSHRDCEFMGCGQSVSSMLYVTQRGNITLPPVMALNTTTGAMVYSWGDDGTIAQDPETSTWGAHGIVAEDCPSTCNGGPTLQPRTRIWICDFTGHTLTAHSADTGSSVLGIGTKGVAGVGTNPLQFDRLADAAVELASDGKTAYTYVADGDGGSANRVVKVASPLQSIDEYSVVWATSAIFNNPHSIALHPRTHTLLVADRENEAVHLLDAHSGADLGVLRGAVGLWGGDHGKPFSVRTLSFASSNQTLDLIFVSVMDNPQDGGNQRIVVIDASSVSSGMSWTNQECSVVQVLNIHPKLYSGPHMLTLDPATGDLYAALVADDPLSTVLRFRCVGC